MPRQRNYNHTFFYKLTNPKDSNKIYVHYITTNSGEEPKLYQARQNDFAHLSNGTVMGKDVEKYGAIDATGFSTFNKRNWIDIRLSKVLKKKFKKLHILTGVKSNTVISAKVTDGDSSDSIHLPYLTKKSIYFDLKEISADKGYIGMKNCEAIAKIGATPFILPRKNMRTPRV